MTANGGTGGVGYNGSSPGPFPGGSGGSATATGTSIVKSVTITGQRANYGHIYNGVNVSTSGGSTIWGTGGAGGEQRTTGAYSNPATGYGGGGAVGWGANTTGGAASQGAIIIDY